MDLEGSQAAGYPHNRRNRHGEGHGIEQELSEFSGLPPLLFTKRKNHTNIDEIKKRAKSGKYTAICQAQIASTELYCHKEQSVFMGGTWYPP
jgi:hypothetical protein